MDQHKITWVASARKELDEIIDHIAKDKKEIAKTIYFKIKDKVQALSNMPQQGRLIPEFQTAGIELYREIIEHPWRIMYRIRDNEILILTIIDGRRNIEDIIFDKLLGK